MKKHIVHKTFLLSLTTLMTFAVLGGVKALTATAVILYSISVENGLITIRIRLMMCIGVLKLVLLLQQRQELFGKQLLTTKNEKSFTLKQ